MRETVAKTDFKSVDEYISTHPENVQLVCTGERSAALSDYMDGFVYLGPEPDRSLLGSIPLTAAQLTELERRANISRADPQRTMRARFSGRDQWFAAHPKDFPPRPLLQDLRNR